tara:strand:- start:1781 stop:2950 length:1170 start_codon:yes stop_codon:yes gene_type:complete
MATNWERVITEANDADYKNDSIEAGDIPTLNQNTTGSSATCSGLAGSATVLASARTIAGVSFNGSANISLNNNAITNGAGYTTNTGDITGVTAGTGMSGGGSSGAVTLNCSITNNNQLTNGAGYTTNTGDITGVTAGSGMSGGGTSGSVTLTNASPNIVYPAETKSTINALDITELGIVTSGQWRGTTVDASYGGTGLTSTSTLLNSNVTTVSGNAGTVTNGVYTTGTQDIDGDKTFLAKIYADDGIAIGGTGAANTLEDYETGSWTPVLTSGWSHSYDSTTNRYVKVGSFVHLWGRIDGFSGSSSTADLQITGLPFTVKHSAVGGDCMLKWISWNSKAGNVSPYVNTSEILYFFETASAYEWSKVSTADLTSGTTDDIYFSIQYETDQ